MLMLQYEYPDINRYIGTINLLNSRFKIIDIIKSDSQKISYKVIDMNGNLYFCKAKFLDSVTDDEIQIYDLLKSKTHKNINGVKHIFHTDGIFIVMSEFIDGETLQLRKHHDIKTVVSGIVDGIQFLHQNDIIHSDLKPTNIIIRTDGTPVIIDFDYSKRSIDGVCKNTKISGTKFFLSPEIVYYQIYTNKMDIWALGVIAYLMYENIDSYDSSEYFFTMIDMIDIEHHLMIDCLDKSIASLIIKSLDYNYINRPNINALKKLINSHISDTFSNSY